MHKSKSERLVTLAIRAGCKNGADIAKETGLNIGTVYQQIGLLETEHGVTDLVALRAALNPPSPDDVRAKYPEFTSHDCVILDKQLPPHIAASFC